MCVLSTWRNEELASIAVEANLRAFPDDPGVHFCAVDIMLNMGRKAEALKLFKAALANPELTIFDHNYDFRMYSHLLSGGAREFAVRASSCVHPHPRPPLMSTFDAGICAGRGKQKPSNPFWCPPFLKGVPFLTSEACMLTSPFRCVYGGPPPNHAFDDPAFQVKTKYVYLI